MKGTWVGLGVAFLVACGGDTAAGTDIDTATETAQETSFESDTADADVAPLETAIAPDTDPTDARAGSETTPASDTTIDEGVTEADLDTPAPTDTDAPSETGAFDTGDALDPPWPTDRPHGQCASGVDCPGDLVCAETAPGGICNGCGADPCPDGTSCNQFGACSRDCTEDADCPAGLRCHGSQQVCVLVTCVEASDCTRPYVCDANLCRRPQCAAAGCPAPFVCAGDVCVEPYFAP